MTLNILNTVNRIEKKWFSFSPAMPREPLAIDESNWYKWLKTLFLSTYTSSFADHHIEFWEHIANLQDKPPAWFSIWPRGGGKTTNVESAAIYLGATGKRKFCLYVRSTQARANESVQNIGAKIERCDSYYSKLSQRSVGKYGHSKGWRMDMLRCANGFNVVALGLDVAARGVKLDDYRPDLIIFDDIDDELDTQKTIEKKIKIITRSILPAGANNAAIIGVQNLIHEQSIFSQIANNTADFLHNRIVSGPIPAIEGLATKQNEDGTYTITGGKPTWLGQDIETCQNQITEWGLTAFKREAQHEVQDKGGIFEHVKFIHCKPSDIPELVEVVVWCDPAITATDKSDSCGIQVDGLAVNDKIYRLHSWEEISSPLEAITEAIRLALHYKASCVGIETDQGGDTWEIVYEEAWRQLAESGEVSGQRIPEFRENKAGAGHGPKAHRGSLMLAAYEQGTFIHVLGTHTILEKSLKRFLVRKPYDLVDAAYWSWYDLTENMVSVGGGKK